MTTVSADEAVLDNAVWESLIGPHAHLAQVHGLAARYPSEVAGFHALADSADPQAWRDLTELTGPDADVAVAGDVPAEHPGWEVVDRIPGCS
ncbi:hypothetical protein [Paractinoplanes durhamensis]|uniref:hypothetical protein n=1 Tax=Paractinoplanes durhamensis TaxID=113563 RepID=UPI00362A0E75